MIPSVVSIPLGRKEVQTDKLIIGEKRSTREFSGLKGVHTQVKFVELLARYLGTIELACILQLLRHRI